MHKDALGNQLAVGDYIVYASMSGRSPQLNFGQIIELIPYAGKHGCSSAKKIKAKSVIGTWYGNGGRPAARPSSLAFLDRMVKVPSSSVPEEVKAKIDKCGAKK